MGATSGAGTAYPSWALEFTPCFLWGSCYLIFSFMCMFCRSLYVLLSFFFWPLCCLFFDLWILFGIFKLFLESFHFNLVFINTPYPKEAYIYDLFSLKNKNNCAYYRKQKSEKDPQSKIYQAFRSFNLYILDYILPIEDDCQ
jgi:hypothetical protein